jgi:hypothetical protein
MEKPVNGQIREKLIDLDGNFQPMGKWEKNIFNGNIYQLAFLPLPDRPDIVVLFFFLEVIVHPCQAA